MNHTLEQINEAFEKMPENLRKALYSIKIGEILQKLGTKYSIHMDKLGQIDGEITGVLIGLEQANDFPDKIKSLLPEKTDTEISQIILEINDQIFKPIREKYTELEEYKKETEAEKIEKAIEGLDSGESATLRQFGINVNKKNINTPDKNEVLDTESSRSNMIKTIENPPSFDIGSKTLGSIIEKREIENIVEEKLGGQFGLPKNETDYTIRPKVEESQNIKRIDPYREIPE